MTRQIQNKSERTTEELEKLRRSSIKAQAILTSYKSKRLLEARNRHFLVDTWEKHKYQNLD